MMMLWSSAAMAAIVDQELRVFHRTDLDDVDGTGGEDYLVTNTTYLARHAFVYLYDTTGSNNFPVAYGHTDANGRITFEDLDTNKDYTLQLWSIHNVNGRPVKVVDANDDEFTVSAPEHSPVGGGILLDQVYYATTPGQEWINVAAVASWTVYRRQSSFKTYASNGAYYLFKLDDPSNCPGGSNADATYCYPDLAVYLDPTEEEANSKYTIAHELGHMMQHWALVPNSAANPADWMYASGYGAVSNAVGCNDVGTDHKFNSFEYQSAAIVEGMAHYIAAVAFNNTTEGDCRYDPNTSLTWDPHFSPSSLQFSCEGWDPGNNTGDNGGVEWWGYDPVGAGIEGHNFFAHDPFHINHLPCSANTITTNRGIELDWLRFFWDLDHNTSLNLDTSDIVDAWVDAAPAGNGALNPWNVDDSGLSTDNPMPRLRTSFVSNSYLSLGQWVTYAGYNGVNQ